MFYQDLQGIAKQSGRGNHGGRLSINQKEFNDRLSAQENVATNLTGLICFAMALTGKQRLRESPPYQFISPMARITLTTYRLH